MKNTFRVIVWKNFEDNDFNLVKKVHDVFEFEEVPSKFSSLIKTAFDNIESGYYKANENEFFTVEIEKKSHYFSSLVP